MPHDTMGRDGVVAPGEGGHLEYGAAVVLAEQVAGKFRHRAFAVDLVERDMAFDDDLR